MTATPAEPVIAVDHLTRRFKAAAHTWREAVGLSDEQLQRLNAWVGRCCASLTGGHQVADIALLYPVESLWTRFTPSRFGSHIKFGEW